MDKNSAQFSPTRLLTKYGFVGILLFGLGALAGNPAQSEAQTRVTAKPLRQITITVPRSVPADVLSLRQATVASQISATVTTLPLLVGDSIEAGALIATLDCTDNELLLAQATAEIAALSANQTLASRQLERLNKLRASNNASEEEINQKQSELDVVRARIKAQNIAIESAQRGVEKCRIVAPFGGIVTAIHSEKGNFVTPGSAIVSLVDVDNVELSARVHAGEAAQMKNAATLHFLYQNEQYPVLPRTTLRVVDAVTQSRIMRLRFSGRHPFPGANGRLQWTLPGKIVPASLVVHRDNQNGVFIIATGDSGEYAKFVPIPGAGPGQPVAVELPEDTLIIVDGRYNLQDGAPVARQ